MGSSATIDGFDHEGPVWIIREIAFTRSLGGLPVPQKL
jgi:hypothetical protein